jgi:hypothetical protein
LKVLGAMGAVVAAAGLVWAGSAAYACTTLPSINLSQAYGTAGSGLQLSGTSWGRAAGVISVHWDGLTGPLLATVTSDDQGVLGPVSLTVPAGAAPGYHVIVTTGQPKALAAVARAEFQVVGSAGAPGAAPGALLPASSPPVQRGAGAATLALLLGLGASGVGLFGAGTVSLIRSSRRVPVTAVPLRRR